MAAFFSLLPVHVESVAWVAERKDVLSGFFFMLTLCLYVWHVQKPDIKKYALVLLSFFLGLMSKSMLVTLPVMMILLDYWPLGRFQSRWAGPAKSAKTSWGPVVIWQLKEKLPFFLLSMAVGLIILKAQVEQNVATGKALFSFSERLANAFVSYLTYIINILTPYNLGAFYPFDPRLPVLTVSVSVLLFSALCIGAVLAVRRYPFVFVGWFWFVILLFPVSGLVPLGKHALTDRYTYLASIGISFILAWGLPEFFKTELSRKKVLLPAGVVYLAVLTCLTWVQAGYWQDDLTLFGRTLSVTKNNDLMHYNIAWSYAQAGDLEKAKAHLHEALRIDAREDRYYANLGLVYEKSGDKDKAIYYYEEGLKRNPDNDTIHSNLGTTLESSGRKAEALEHYRKAMAINPRMSPAHYNYATLMLEQGRVEEAEKELREAIALNSHYREALNELAVLLLNQGRTSESIAPLRELIRLDPGNVPAIYALANSLARESRLDEAVLYYHRAADLDTGNPNAHYNLGVVSSARGDVQDAIGHFQAALQIKPDYAKARQALRNLLAKMRNN